MKTAISDTEMVTISRAEYDALLQKSEGYAELNQKLEWLMEQLRLVKKRPTVPPLSTPERADGSAELCL